MWPKLYSTGQNPMKKYNLKTGKIGEEMAKEYLERKGYKILKQNYRTKFEEIDLIVKDGKELVLVEVRTKKGEIFGSPEESLTKGKLQKLRLSAKIIKASRVDAICIVLREDNSIQRLEHYQNIV